MSDASSTESNSVGVHTARRAAARRANRVLGWFMWTCVLVAILIVGDAYLVYRPAVQGKLITDQAAVRTSGLIDQPSKHLDSRFTDSHGRLLADPPTSPDQWSDPATIVIGRWESSSDETPDIDWAAFEKHLTEATGKSVKVIKYDNSAQAIAQIKNGQITLVALHAADAPFLVNNCGYQPAAVLSGDSDAVSGNRLDLIVPAKSEIQKPSDLRGHTLVCAAPSSITGYRAAVALLMENENLRPNVDYFITFSLKQKASIQGVIDNKSEAAAVSDDKLQGMLDSGKINKDSFRSIYQSEIIPRMTIGWFYNLKPELAEKIRAAILSYKPADQEAASQKPATGPSSSAKADGVEDTSAEASSFHWVPVDYRKDFQLVRLIDDRFDPRLDTKASK